MINCGLLDPKDVVEVVCETYRKHRGTIPVNATEGFVRQIIGWREFIRMIYQNFSNRQWQSNFFDHNRTFADEWYTGDLGIPPVDDAIKKAAKYGYTHHIERLMLLSNLMLLSEIHPHSVYHWFMTMSVDAADWAMYGNVFGMGQFSDGGIFATKPYICGSNYILKMGDYRKDAWCDIVDGLYWRFIMKHQGVFKKNPRMSMMVRSLHRLSTERQKVIFPAAEDFLNKYTL